MHVGSRKFYTSVSACRESPRVFLCVSVFLSPRLILSLCVCLCACVFLASLDLIQCVKGNTYSLPPTPSSPPSLCLFATISLSFPFQQLYIFGRRRGCRTNLNPHKQSPVNAFKSPASHYIYIKLIFRSLCSSIVPTTRENTQTPAITGEEKKEKPAQSFWRTRGFHEGNTHVMGWRLQRRS